MSDPYLDKIRDYVGRRSRLCFAGHKKTVLRQRLENRLTFLQIRDLEVYWEYLQRTPAEEGRLLDALTTNETFFFRNSSQFRYLRDEILPALEAARGMDVMRSWGAEKRIAPARIMKLRILCAGCSTGEEPYSVAMTILDTLRYPKAWDIEIAAGDLSESCLETAAAAFYGDDRLKGLPPGYLDRYLERRDGGAVVKGGVRELVRFFRLNLSDVMNGGGMPGHAAAAYDIVFCRNVMIYFSSACQQQLVDTLHRLLVPGGYLLTGDAEPLHLFTHDFLAVDSARCLIYQKRMERENNAEYSR